MAATVLPPFSDAQLEAISAVLGDTYTGLTGREIGELLARVRIDDPGPMTKRYRLYEAFVKQQERDRSGNAVAAFVQHALDPVRYVRDPTRFEMLRLEVNEVLEFCGLQLGDDGRLERVPATRSLTASEDRARRLREAALTRGVHPDVLHFCRAELLQDNYFHAVFEATKSVADKIRRKTGLDEDGAVLIDKALGYRPGGYPLLAFNSLRTKSERSEHVGLMNLMKGMFGTFRNVTAHEPKVSWPIGERDALDLLALCSFLHRRLDDACPTGARPEAGGS